MPASVRSAASSGQGGPPGGSGTSSIQPPLSRISRVFSLFAFQSARVSVVRTGQPTLTSFRAIQGATTTTAPATTAAASSTERRERSSGRATNAARTSGRSASRVLPRIARPAAAPSSERQQRALPLRDDECQERDDRDEQPVEDLAVHDACRATRGTGATWRSWRRRCRPRSEAARRPISRTIRQSAAAIAMCAMPTTSQCRSKSW